MNVGYDNILTSTLHLVKCRETTSVAALAANAAALLTVTRTYIF